MKQFNQTWLKSEIFVKMKENWLLCIINCQNVVIKYNTRVWREYLQQKYQNKNTLQDFRGNTYSKNSKYKEFLFFIFFVFLIYKRAKYKNESNINWRIYKCWCYSFNNKKTNELWVSMKDVGDGLGVKSISDLVLK